MKFFVFALCFFFIYNAVQAVITDLSESNFKKFITTHPYSLVLFYGSWCPHCKSFMPHYENISSLAEARGVPFVFGRVEGAQGSQNSALRDEYNVTAYPTLLIFVNGTCILYKKKLEEEAILELIMQKFWTKLTELKTKEEVIRVKEGRDLRVRL